VSVTWQEALDTYIRVIDEGDAKIKAGTITLREAEAERDRAFKVMYAAIGEEPAEEEAS
jgi:hypothetical protein